MSQDDIIRAVAFVKRGKNKHAVFLALTEPMMPRDLMLMVFKKKSETNFSIISRALADLQSEDLVEIINPEEKTGRIWRPTKKGTAVQTFLLKQQVRITKQSAHDEFDVDVSSIRNTSMPKEFRKYERRVPKRTDNRECMRKQYKPKHTSVYNCIQEVNHANYHQNRHGNTRCSRKTENNSARTIRARYQEDADCTL